MIDYLKNGWNFVHLFGSYFLCAALAKFPIEKWIAVAIAALCGLLWEFCDHIYSKNLHRVNLDIIFDKRGFSVFDMVMDSIGILLYILMEKL